ncbi:hypothetical protein I8J29_16870 [Paenibacillus sp. MWE-103]|uniref:Uncharacterized protein n=1 Tax=Paenibacillus artemisiicola TaxID=1172618 RepID=A0ABS3WC50_9BACL|nr:hypothetical protein [Paenibacillus artemisiicola]MBO7745883.1 hypothetical protein [Paenibacillus artemisiicola]
MSISAFIPEPGSDAERLFHVPVATEAFFEDCWEPAAEELGLRWVPLFATGVELTKADVPEVLGELGRLRAWAERALDGDRLALLLARLGRLTEELPGAFEREGAVVYIG